MKIPVRYRNWVVGWADNGQEGREAVTGRCHALPGRVVWGLGVRSELEGHIETVTDRNPSESGGFGM